MLKEWPLVAFTILGQFAVGVFLFVGGPLFWFGPVPGGDSEGSVRLEVLAAVLGLAAAAALVSLFHLHRPLKAYHALSNLGTSWLSREILFELGFLALVAALGFCSWLGAGRPVIRWIYSAALASGLLFLWSMSKLYMLPSLPGWNHAHTPLAFFLTTFALGATAAAVFFGCVPNPPSFLRTLLAVSIAFLAADLVNSLLLSPELGVFGVRTGPSLKPPGATPWILYVFRTGLLAGSAAILVFLLGFAWKVRPGTGSPAMGSSAIWLPTAFVLALAGEVIGRLSFYGLLGRPADSPSHLALDREPCLDIM